MKKKSFILAPMLVFTLCVLNSLFSTITDGSEIIQHFAKNEIEMVSKSKYANELNLNNIKQKYYEAKKKIDEAKNKSSERLAREADEIALKAIKMLHEEIENLYNTKMDETENTLNQAKTLADKAETANNKIKEAIAIIKNEKDTPAIDQATEAINQAKKSIDETIKKLKEALEVGIDYVDWTDRVYSNALFNDQLFVPAEIMRKFCNVYRKIKTITKTTETTIQAAINKAKKLKTSLQKRLGWTTINKAKEKLEQSQKDFKTTLDNLKKLDTNAARMHCPDRVLR